MKKILKAGGIILALLAIYYAAQIIVGAVFGVVYAFGEGMKAGPGGQLPDMDALFGDLMNYLNTMTPYVILIAAAVTLPSYYLIYRRRRQELLTFVSVRSFSAVSVIMLVVFSLSVNVVIELLLTLANELQALSGYFEQYEELAGAITGGGFVMSLVSVGVVAPVLEEILFRGLVFGELRKIAKVPLALVIQAALFGLYHLNVIQGSYAFLLGILLGFVYYRSNSILAPMILHIVINSSSVLVSFLVPGEQLSAWGGVILVAGVAVFFLTGAFLLLGKNFRRCMDNGLYEQNRFPKTAGPDADI